MPRPRNKGKYGKPAFNQAAKVIARFGGEARMAKALGVSRVTCYRWSYARPCGSDGLIPTEHVEKIKAIARAEGILIRPEDWVPEKIEYPQDAKPQVIRIPMRPQLADILA